MFHLLRSSLRQQSTRLNVASSRSFTTQNGSRILHGTVKCHGLVRQQVPRFTSLRFLSTDDGTLRNGTVKWFDAKKGFGFVIPEDGSEDVFVHQTSIHSEGFRSLADGEPVEFTTYTNERGRTQAARVTGPMGAYVQGAPRRSFGRALGGGPPAMGDDGFGSYRSDHGGFGSSSSSSSPSSTGGFGDAPMMPSMDPPASSLSSSQEEEEEEASSGFGGVGSGFGETTPSSETSEESKEESSSESSDSSSDEEKKDETSTTSTTSSTTL